MFGTSEEAEEGGSPDATLTRSNVSHQAPVVTTTKKQKSEPTIVEEEEEKEEEEQPPPPSPPPPSISMRIQRLGPQAAVVASSRRGLARTTTAPGSVVRPYTLGAPHPDTVAAFSKGVGLVVAQGSALNIAKKKMVK